MILRVVLEGLVLGALLILLCAIGIRKSPVNMVYLYPSQVQENQTWPRDFQSYLHSRLHYLLAGLCLCDK